MKLKIRYPTKEKKIITKQTFQFIERQAELAPTRILRSACGIGMAANRYYYFAEFKAPNDAEFSNNGVITVPINRKDNPRFNPKKFNWVGDVCSV